MKINFKWPHTRTNNYAPWYIVGWRLIWIVPIYLARIQLTVLAYLSHGSAAAKGMWKDTY